MKTCKEIVRGSLRITMVSIFILNAYISVSRYWQDEKSVYITFREVEQVQYPSLTVCKRQAFDVSLDDMVHGNNATAEQIGVAILSNITRKEDIFYFVSHPNMTGEEHPCLTTADSMDHGKPCVFPFNSSEGLQYSCKRIYFNLGWCGTKSPTVLPVLKDWGYCSNKCTNQSLLSNGLGDLTPEEMLWESRFYDLRSWEEGYCYTYNPPKPSSVNINEGIGIFFKKLDVNDFLSHNIYLHEKGQFWPSKELQALGQSEKIIVEKNKEVSGRFRIQYRRKSQHCTKDKSYSFTDCVTNYIAARVGCAVNWISPRYEMNIRNCSKSEEIQKYKEIMINLKGKGYEDLRRTTKCSSKCSITAYTFYKQKTKEDNSSKNWTSAFYLHSSNQPPLNSVQRQTYNLPQLTSDIGGYLGLYLGWSLLYIGLEGPGVILRIGRKLLHFNFLKQ